MNLPSASMREFAERYTQAWCGQEPERVASFFAANGSLRVNDGHAAVGRAAISEVARGFMTAFPDLRVRFDDLVPREDGLEYHWTLTGTNTGPGGTGNPVRISGYETWRMDSEGWIAESQGRFDAEEYERQLRDGI